MRFFLSENIRSLRCMATTGTRQPAFHGILPAALARRCTTIIRLQIRDQPLPLRFRSGKRRAWARISSSVFSEVLIAIKLTLSVRDQSQQPRRCPTVFRFERVTRCLTINTPGGCKQRRYRGVYEIDHTRDCDLIAPCYTEKCATA